MSESNSFLNAAATTDSINRLVSSSAIMSECLGKATNIQMAKILEQRTDQDFGNRKTRIVCTMGPSCNNVKTIVTMIESGMNVCRLNFSHGDHDSHKITVQNIHEAQKIKPEAQVAILLDTKGPEIRTGLLENKGPVQIKQDEEITISTDYTKLGNSNLLTCSYEKLPQSVKPGTLILIADGTLSIKVKSVHDDHIIGVAQNTAVIGEKKNMNLPGVKVDLPCIGEKDKNDILKFGIPMNVDFVAPSFVQTKEDVKYLRNLLGARGRRIKIIPKIENLEGLKNFDEILSESDGIMIARGDLGMEIPPEKVFIAQKMMISKCNIAGKPVITATQMLESMIKNPRPTRAEAADVANAVLDGTDCVMLSGETAGGAFPVEAVQVMARICVEAESCISHKQLCRAISSAIPSPISIPEAVCRSAVETAENTNAKLIVVLTETGQTARFIAKYRPRQPIFALSASESTIRHLQITRGIKVHPVPSFQGTDALIQDALKIAKEQQLVVSGDEIVAVHGIREEVAGSSNLLKVLRVD